MVDAYDFACWGDEMMQDRDEVSAAASDVEYFGTWMEIWEKVFSGVGMLSYDATLYRITPREASKYVPCEGH